MLAALLVLAGAGSAARAQRTPLLEMDLETGKGRRFDAGGPKTEADRELDALLDKGSGPTFSSKDLDGIARALRRYLASSRPRAMPKMVLFLYPGRISKSRLKELREVLVDIELVVDPCGRSVCKEALGTHLELLGRAMKQVHLRTSRYSIRFGAVIIKRRMDTRDAEVEILRFKPEDVVEAGRAAGGGARLVERRDKSEADFEETMARLVSQRTKARRVRLSQAPGVQRARGSVTVSLVVDTDRVRFKDHVVGALAGAAEALQKSALTPSTVSMTVVARIRFRKTTERTFACEGHAVALYLGGRLSQSELWSTYVVERKKEGTHFAFDDDEAAGRDRPPAASAPDRTEEILAAHTGHLAPCLQEEARRSRGFKGVTMVFTVTAAGRVTGLSLKEKQASAALRRCLGRALERIRFPARAAARQVEYPMFIQR